jgi:hypothetical protein
MRRALVVALSLGILAGCQQATPLAPSTGATTESMTRRLKAEGDALMVKGDYAGALVKYQLAAGQEPGDVSIRFALGSALSYLDRRDETVAEFRWVVAHGQPGSVEVREARNWLATAGVPGFDNQSGGDPSVASQVPATESAGRIVGQTEWPGVNFRDRVIRGRVSVSGDEPRTQAVQRARPFRLGDAFEFKNLPAGNYQLVAEAWGVKLWEQQVTVERGRNTEVSLTSASSPVSPSQFPDGVKPPEE